MPPELLWRQRKHPTGISGQDRPQSETMGEGEKKKRKKGHELGKSKSMQKTLELSLYQLREEGKNPTNPGG